MSGKREGIGLGEIRARGVNHDEAALARLGKKSALKVSGALALNAMYLTGFFKANIWVLGDNGI